MLALEQMQDTFSPLVCRIVQCIQSTFADEGSGTPGITSGASDRANSVICMGRTIRRASHPSPGSVSRYERVYLINNRAGFLQSRCLIEFIYCYCKSWGYVIA